MEGIQTKLKEDAASDLSAFMTPYELKPRHSEVNLDHTQNLGARITCAHSLYKLSCQVGSELAIIGGGAIAQIADFSDVEDSKVLRYSATVLVNVTTDLSVLEDFASKDGVSALLELSWTPLMDVKVACTTALCRLSQSRARAAVLVRCRAITELLSMLTVPHVPLQQLVVSCIANLVFYGHSFPDRVFVGDPQAVQSPLGLMNVISQMSASPSTSQSAVEALFNLSLYRSSCLGVLRGGGAETLHTLVSQLCKLVDGNGGGSSSRFLLSLGVQPPAWTADMSVCMRLLRLAADTLANFSAHVEYHNMMGSHGIKSLSLMLSGALRDVGNFNSSVTTEERFRCTSIPCSRALANFSSNIDLRRQNFPQDLIQQATKLALMDHKRYAANARDARTLMRNAIRTLCNLSFESSCRSAFTEVPQVLLMLHAITPIWYLRSSRASHASGFPWTTDMSEDAKEDALIALLNFAQQATFANELLRTLDGKLLAAAAEDVGHSRRLRYIYASVLCNLLFDNYLQQLVYGDQKDQFQALNLAFDDDQERFLASIFLIANELMDMANIELVVMLALPCMKTYLSLATSIPSNSPPSHPRRIQLQRQLPITCYASASLFALTRAATQRRDSQKHVTHSDEAESMLIAAFCAATLYHLCASTSVNLRVIQGLINCCNVNEESQSLLACSAAFAIISFTAEGCQQLVQCADLARALNRLGRTSQVECQQYAAIAACNVSTVACVWSSAELKDFIVVALLRANSIQAKQIHAKTLSNLLSHGATRPKVVEDGVFSIGLRALFNLSCDRQYHHKLLANGVMAYLSTAQQQLQCLAGHLSMESRRFALAIICNLASYEENHKELMRAQVMEVIRNYVDGDIESRASAAMALRNLSCRQPWVEMLCERKTLQLLILCTECDHPIVRQFAIEALANCSLVTDSLHLFGEMRVPRAVLTLLEVTANGLPATSTASPVSVTYMAALKCLHNIAHDDSLALALMEENIILRLLPLLEYRALGSDVYACELAASLTHTLAGKPKCAEALLRQRTVSLCALLHRRHANSSVIARECVRVLMLLSTYQHIQLQLCETQAVHVIVSICGGGGASTTSANPLGSARNLRLRECGAVTIRNLTLSVTEHLALFYEKHDDGDGSLYDVGVTPADKPVDTMKDLEKEDDNESGDPDKDASVSLMLERHMLHGIKYFQEEIVSGQASDRILLEASAAIANLSTVKVFRVAMVRRGMIQTLLQLMSQPKPKAQRMTLSTPVLTPGPTSPLRLRNTYRNSLLGRICAATLHRLVVEEGAAVDARSQLIPSLLSVLRQTDEELQQVRYECEKISIFSFNMQKWMVYVLKTILSSQAMIPQLEKKQMRVLGTPKLCFQDLSPGAAVPAPAPVPANGSTSSRSTNSGPHNDVDTTGEGGGYLLPVSMEKHVIRRINGSEEIVPISVAAATSSATSSRNLAAERDASAIDPQGHVRKFDRQMRLLRRNDRRDISSLPPV
ncbi:hypothetical protein PHYSODRAFT_482602 [Phytophthora sojae]|uniref:Vacuolar protein 8 n=1 Tax=Phytophthora sojae (strain P6497) TaxID=1094619 RepID=G4YS33_PHYSP|nr:hypothetical protein PHYSODRAFT_482602 [Phytophthora sojae]EGZ24170.1 hypothetical protein PHYSODRAFT_482602 [Phytophthora sojae]|eukprot:XP_009519458.1 hypothetical protein PHYSODRAFT_482602 [Phytophthora sojae]